MRKFISILALFYIGLFTSAKAEDRIVTNLNDSGEGSFRSAVSTDGPANIIFKVSGDILLNEPLEVAGRSLSIDGESATGIGVRLVGFGLKISGSDFNVKNLRIWVGDAYNDPDDSPKQDGVLILGTKSKPITKGEISNCTIFGAVDEGFSTYGEVKDVTIYRNMIIWGLAKSHHQDVINDKNPDKDKIHHSMAILVSPGTKNIQFVQNLIALNRHRNPRVMPGTSVLFANNFVYGWGPSVDDALYVAGKDGLSDEMKIAFVNNYYKGVEQSFFLSPGSLTNEGASPSQFGSAFRLKNATNYSIFDKGNLVVKKDGAISPYNSANLEINSDNPKKIGVKYFDDLFKQYTLESLLEAQEVPSAILKNAGAMPSNRDKLEHLIIHNITESKGSFIDSPKDLDIGYPYKRKNTR